MEKIFLAGKVYVAEYNGNEFDIRVWDTCDVTVYCDNKEIGEVRPDPELYDALWDEANEGVSEETVIRLLTEYFNYDEEDLVDEEEEA
jgi:hypothetical protein